MVYQWRQKLFQRSFEILSENNVVGKLTFNNLFSSEATGVFNDQTYSLRRKGILKPSVIVSKGNERIEICLNTWRTKAILNNKWNWSSNIWLSKWKWRDLTNEPLISSAYKNIWGTEGSISINENVKDWDPNLLLLTGLYVNNYFVEMTFLVILVIAASA